MLFFFILLCLLVGVGIGLAGFVLLIILGLGFTGVISASVIFGLYKKSLSSGFRVFFILGSSLCGFVFCSLLFPLLNKIMHWATFPDVLFAGMAIGSLAGFVAGAVAYQLLKWAISFLRNQLQETPALKV